MVILLWGLRLLAVDSLRKRAPATGHEVGIGDCRTVRAKSKSFTATNESNGCAEFSESFSSRDVEARDPMFEHNRWNECASGSSRQVEAGERHITESSALHGAKHKKPKRK
jgi:hypothetical protein